MAPHTITAVGVVCHCKAKAGLRGITGFPHTNTIVITAAIESGFVAKDDLVPFRCSPISSCACYQEVLKQKQIVKVANNGQMTVDRSKFTQEGSTTSRTKVGKAMQTCSNNGDDRMYQEAARAIQCVFDQLKQSC
ncbi:uncharacterized protein TNCV_3702861 [Trichonephila clavipes]|nr:uncharacterized protein TNCV_3702861 [Trichonephila clavipes]